MAKHPIEIHPEAAQEARAARAWYAERSPNAARAFDEELDDAIRLIRENPQRWPEYIRGTRRFRLDHFPFLVVYRQLPDRVRVMAVAHAHRRTGYWRKRT